MVGADDSDFVMTLRPMTTADVMDVNDVVSAAADNERRARRPGIEVTPQQRERMREATTRFANRDPAGAWVAISAGRVIGMAASIRRRSFWGLSMLFVDPKWQNRGVGHRLLDAASKYAEDVAVRMILTSHDPRALRRYSLAGLTLHPSVEASGVVDRSTIPPRLPGRHGDATDLELVAEVDSSLGRSRAEHVGFLLSIDSRLEVLDARSGRGYVVYGDRGLQLLGATDESAAATLLWRYLAEVEGEAAIWTLTATQNWAVRVALAARLTVVPSGPLFVDGTDRPPGPWIPSGSYF